MAIEGLGKNSTLYDKYSDGGKRDVDKNKMNLMNTVNFKWATDHNIDKYIKQVGVNPSELYNSIQHTIGVLELGLTDESLSAEDRKDFEQQLNMFKKLHGQMSKNWSGISFGSSKSDYSNIELGKVEIKDNNPSTGEINGKFIDKKGKPQEFNGSVIIPSNEQEKTNLANQLFNIGNNILSSEQLENAHIETDSTNNSLYLQYNAGDKKQGYLKLYNGDDKNMYALQREQDGYGRLIDKGALRIDKNYLKESSSISKNTEKSMQKIEKNGLTDGNINEKGLKELKKLFDDYNKQGIPIPDSIAEKINKYTEKLTPEQIKDFNTSLTHSDDGAKNVNLLDELQEAVKKKKT